MKCRMENGCFFITDGIYEPPAPLPERHGIGKAYLACCIMAVLIGVGLALFAVNAG